MADAASGPAAADEGEKPNKRRFRRIFVALVFAASVVVACSLLAVEATESLAEPTSCAMCHEMQDAYDSWARSPHHANPSGVRVTCVSCHLPPREDHFDHLTAKAWSGTKDACVHFFGDYDARASRRTVLQTMPSQRCLHCHDNLLAMPRSSAVGVVHGLAVERTDDRRHACVACHDALHGPKAPPAKRKTYEPADNSYCYVCHINFDGEEFVTDHLTAAVGCTACHGECLEHADDEDHVTPPDIMYRKEQVNASCMSEKCHAEAPMKKEIGHRPFYAGADSERKCCTDCHGMHRLPKRQRRWDKTSRKLIWRDGYSVENDDAPGP